MYSVSSCNFHPSFSLRRFVGKTDSETIHSWPSSPIFPIDQRRLKDGPKRVENAMLVRRQMRSNESCHPPLFGIRDGGRLTSRCLDSIKPSIFDPALPCASELGRDGF